MNNSGIWALAVVSHLLFSSASVATLTVCVYSRAPFFSLEEQSGIEYDLLTTFADRQGLKLELDWSDGGLEKMFRDLEEGNCDIAVGMLTPTAKREKQMSFSEPYFPVRVVLLSRQAHETLIGSRVAVLPNTSHEDLLKNVEGITLVYGKSYPDIVRMVFEGTADAMACDSATVLVLMKKYPTLNLTPAPVGGQESFSFAVQKGSPLKDQLDTFLRSIKKDGTYAEILRRYIDDETVELVLDETMEPELETDESRRAEGPLRETPRAQ